MTPHAPRRLFVPSEAGFAHCVGEIQQPPMPEPEPQPRDAPAETGHEPVDRSAAHGLVTGVFRLLGIFL